MADIWWFHNAFMGSSAKKDWGLKRLIVMTRVKVLGMNLSVAVENHKAFSKDVVDRLSYIKL